MKTQHMLLLLIVLTLVMCVDAMAQQPTRTVYAGYSFAQVEYLEEHNKTNGVKGYVYKTEGDVSDEASLRKRLLIEDNRGTWKVISPVTYVIEKVVLAAGHNPELITPAKLLYGASASVQIYDNRELGWEKYDVKNTIQECDSRYYIYACIWIINEVLYSHLPWNYPWFKSPISFEKITCANK